MPIYKNSTDYIIQSGLLRFLPGEEKTVNRFLPYNTLGLDLISSSPEPTDPTLYSGTLSVISGSPSVINIPENVTKYSLSVIATDGAASLQFNNTGNRSIPLSADDALGYNNTLDFSYANKIIISTSDTATVIVVIESVA